jgi:hypothetical protein
MTSPSTLQGVKAGIEAAAKKYVSIWVCQGPPRCDLEGDEAVTAQQAGCKFCREIRIDDDGRETAVEPGTC